MENFQKGDVVQLKSGGPKMTVTGEAQDAEGNTLIICHYFEGKSGERNYNEEKIPVEALKKAPKSGSPGITSL